MLAAVRFGAVGAVNTALDVGLFALLAATTDINIALINVASYSCGVLTSFFLNRYWTFADAAGGRGRNQFLQFVLANMASALLSTVLVERLALILPAIAAKIISLPPIFAFNFAVARFVVFRRSNANS